MSPLDHAEDLAKELAGNHRKFGSFAWFGRPEDDAQWCLVYTHNRDSDALDRSNAHVFSKALAPFCTGEDDADCRSEDHSHWACGWVKGFAIRVRDEKGTLTPAFLAYAELHIAKAEYPVLDEEHFSETELKEAELVWRECFSDRERLEWIKEHWSDFEHCQARWNAGEPCEAWRNLLANVRGDWFDGIPSELFG